MDSALPVPVVGLHVICVSVAQLTVSHMDTPMRTVGVGLTLCAKPNPLIATETATETARLGLAANETTGAS